MVKVSGEGEGGTGGGAGVNVKRFFIKWARFWSKFKETSFEILSSKCV